MVDGIVKTWDGDEGWGVLTSPDVPGEVFAHFSNIDADAEPVAGRGHPGAD
jgi:cold shock CspA family protein